MTDLKQTLPFGSQVFGPEDAGAPGSQPEREGKLKAKTVSTRPSARPSSRAPSSGGPWRTVRSEAPGRIDWLAKGRAVASAIETALQTPDPGPNLIAGIERAYSALFLDDTEERDIARVAHVCERAHDAVHRVSPADFENALHDCASALQTCLPGRVRRRVSHDDAVRVVRGMRKESIQLRAVTQATMELLGWIDLYRGRAEQLVQTALREYRAEALK